MEFKALEFLVQSHSALCCGMVLNGNDDKILVEEKYVPYDTYIKEGNNGASQKIYIYMP